MKSLIFASIAVAMFSFPHVNAADLEKGKAAFHSGDYPTAHAEISELATQGNAEAQVYLGSMYEYGLNVKQDNNEAARLFGLAAKQGNAQGQFNYSGMYFYGNGVKKDHVLAYMWAHLATVNGADRAEMNQSAIAEGMSKADISKAKKMAQKCMDSKYINC